MWKRGTTALAQGVLAVTESAVALRGGWVRWQHGSVNRRVLAASVVLAALTIVCKLGAAGREIVDSSAGLFNV